MEHCIGGEGEYNEGKVMTKTFLSPQSKVVVNAHRTHDKKFGQKVRLLLTLVEVICPILGLWGTM